MEKRVLRTDRGNLSRPSVDRVYEYRKHVNAGIEDLIRNNDLNAEQRDILKIGLNHEQQHQELLRTDIKYILGNNPLLPRYGDFVEAKKEQGPFELLSIDEGVYEIGHQGSGFCYDNELGRHRVFLESYAIANTLVTNREFLEFINDGGYQDSNFWHAEAWDWLNKNEIKTPMYWHHENGVWKRYSLNGYGDLNLEEPVTHISYYEAFAFAQWKGMRLPTEFEWEVANDKFDWGQTWEWTESAYLPYPGYKKAPGALGEYNGKFMVNQKVLRGASVATSKGHSRPTYRNFFHPNLRWQFTGIRLAK